MHSVEMWKSPLGVKTPRAIFWNNHLVTNVIIKCKRLIDYSSFYNYSLAIYFYVVSDSLSSKLEEMLFSISEICVAIFVNQSIRNSTCL